MPELSTMQTSAFDTITNYYNNSHDVPYHVIHGYAGSGKTTLLTAFAREHPCIKIVAPTGKAASVLAEKCIRAGVHQVPSTIHSLFYKLLGKRDDPDTGKQVLIFEEKHPKDALVGQTVLLDECSMVSTAMAHDLLISGARIIAFGDPAQLPPVFGSQAFPQSDYLLTEIHRQAAQSAVIRQATSVRHTGHYKADGEDFRVTSYLDDDDILSAGTVLCHRNATRHQLNKRYRKLLGLSGHPRRGEQVMCLKNAKKYGIYNGAVYTLADDVKTNANNAPTTITLLMDGSPVDIPYSGFVESGGELKDFDGLAREPITAFDFGYAMTTHKAQGSEWERVAIVDECKRSDVRRPWLYTSLSRASKSVIIQR